MRRTKSLVVILTISCFVFGHFIGLAQGAFASTTVVEEQNEIKRDAEIALQKTVRYCYDIFSENAFKSVLDWPAVGLYAAGEDLTGSKWSTDDMNPLRWREREVKNGIMLDSRSTDYERTILGVVAGGGDPKNFAGKNLIATLEKAQLPNGKFADSVNGQGQFLVNAHMWGIIALYAAGEDIPKQQQAYEWLVQQQKDDGGFVFDIEADESDIDMTAMALIAFAALGKDKDDPEVVKALNFLRKNQQEDGNFSSWGEANSDSCAMVIQGLIALSIDPTGTEWTKNGKNPVTALLDFQLADGSFSHTPGGKTNDMSTINAMMALADFCNGKSVYTMLHEQSQQVLFKDVPKNYWAYNAIHNLVERKILNGYEDGSFQPEREVKRAEFAKYVVFGLGYAKQVKEKTDRFDDLPLEHWANPIVHVAVNKKLITGVDPKHFAPNSPVTGEQVMTILVRALGYEEEAKKVEGPWYQGYVNIAEEKGLIYPGFAVGKAATRAQCAYSVDMLQRLLERNWWH